MKIFKCQRKKEQLHILAVRDLEYVTPITEPLHGRDIFYLFADFWQETKIFVWRSMEASQQCAPN
ncbi:hypothetical protein Scep_019328 [Stephania cephalantha]|uniref:Uncharacterized protein n=1 Tax=Stephania cephalantha TaxID=152367 RepID=A0AAP0IAK5_9MAGN